MPSAPFPDFEVAASTNSGASLPAHPVRSWHGMKEEFSRALWQIKTLGKWLLLLAPLSVAVGSACAFFLWSLDAVTRVRFEHPWLLYLLPVGGFLVALVYSRLGAGSDA